MGKSLSDTKWIIYRIDKNGFTEKTIFTGNIKLKPKGWKVQGKLQSYNDL